MSDGYYLRALETRLRWLRWADSPQGYVAHWKPYVFKQPHEYDDDSLRIDSHVHMLRHGPTYYVAPVFCDLIGHVLPTLPNDIAFDPVWLFSRNGWLYFDTPFTTVSNTQMSTLEGMIDRPRNGLHIRAMAWAPLNELQQYNTFPRDFVGRFSDDVWAIETYMEHDYDEDAPFGFMDSYHVNDAMTFDEAMHVHQDDPLKFADGQPLNERLWEVNCEDKRNTLRLIFTVFSLMAQKITARTSEPAPRSLRKRIEFERLPLLPVVELITLRRREHRSENPQPTPVDWRWQWLVQHHWRNQFYPSTQEHKWIVIGDYVKGPENKPLKPSVSRIYVARR